AQVGEHEIVLLGLELLGPLLAACRDVARITPGIEDLGHGLSVVPFVVDDQDAEAVLGRVGGIRFDLHALFPRWAAAVRPQRPGILPGRAQLDTRPVRSGPVADRNTGTGGTTVKSGTVPHRWEEWANAATPGANIV